MNFYQLILVINIGLITSIINIFHVIIGYARTLPGQVYMATGHYYLDYFQYLQALSQGWHGHWIYENYYGTDVRLKTFFGMWQYLIIGKIGRLFNLSPIVSYWGSIVFFSIVLSVLIFLVIRKLLIDKPFYWQLAAYILTLFAAPFFRIINQNGHLVVSAFRFWNDKAVLVERFGSIPYHLTDQIIILTVMLLLADCLDRISGLSAKSLVLRISAIIFLFIFLLTFSPAYFVLGISALVLTLIWLFFSKKSFLKIKFLTIILSILLPLGLLIKTFYMDKLYAGVSQTESGWQVHPPFLDVLLTTGPILLFFWLGLKNYFRQLTSIRMIFFNFVFSSYLMFFSPIALYLGTTNTRFLSSLNYILLAVLTVAGIKKLKSLVIISLILLLLFIPGNIEGIKSKINDRNLSSPISYLPQGIVQGYQFLNSQPGKKAVLTTPAEFLGIIAPIYTGKPVYLARPGQLEYYQKADLTARFYLGLMEEKQAEEFLQKNSIEFITLTSIEDYPVDKLFRYKFLKEIYKNNDIIILKKI